MTLTLFFSIIVLSWRAIVIHGYAQTAAIVASNTVALNQTLSDIATLNYVQGPQQPGTIATASRPWWILDNMVDLEFDPTQVGRWNDSVRRIPFVVPCCDAHLRALNQVNWWSNELSTNQYDGIIGLSQGSAMTGLLLSMVSIYRRVPWIRLFPIGGWYTSCVEPCVSWIMLFQIGGWHNSYAEPTNVSWITLSRIGGWYNSSV